MSVVGPRNAWRARHSVAEALANVRAGGFLMATLIALGAAMVAAVVAVDLGAAHRIVAAEDAYLAAGGDLLVAQPAGQGEVDAAACADLAGLAGVRTAFALDVQPGGARLVGRPESQQTFVMATPGVAEFLGLDHLGGDQAAVSTLIADRWQWSPGSRFQLDDDDARALHAPPGVLTVAAVSNLELISQSASTGVLLVRAPTGTAQACYVQVMPSYKKDLKAAIPALLGESSRDTIQVAERLPAGGFAQDPAREFEARPTRWAGAGAGAVAGLLWAVVAWTRRGRAALYASIGVPYSGGVLIRWTEGMVVVVSGILWGAVLSVGAAMLWSGADAGLGVTMALQHLVAALATGVLVVVLTGLPRPPTLSALKDR
jgi:hypothetical protein